MGFRIELLRFIVSIPLWILLGMGIVGALVGLLIAAMIVIPFLMIVMIPIVVLIAISITVTS